jgi:ferritin-like metal-binding protein YciE
MSSPSIDDQLVAYLSDAHAIEQQALAQLRRAPEIAEDPGLALALRTHEAETERHERLVRERLEAHGASPSRIKDAAMAAGGVGFALFARSQPDTPGKLAAHAFSYEHLELAAYELLAHVAERAGDAQTVAVAREIRDEEAAMADRLLATFDGAVKASLAARGAHPDTATLVTYLADAHAIETQAVELLEKATKVGGEPALERAYATHLDETRRHRAAIERLLDARDADPSTVKDAAMRAGAINWGLFFQGQPDTPGKLAAFAFAFEHLEIAAYEELLRVAAEAGAADVVDVVDGILREEHAAAEQIAAHFDEAAQASLDALGVGS